ncbi:MAG: DUF2953 domain-containing protein, partial [Thermoanaerobacteraceae bacterium]|nr:DUF2953 domain-containing protein [Thermoanaerobacteraceae bacterium]
EDTIKHLVNNSKNKPIVRYDVFFKQLFFRLINKISIVKLTVKMDIGLIDAAVTSIIIGLMWNLLSFLFVFLSTYTRKMNFLNIAITPVFNELKFECYVDCIIKIRTGYIIFESLKTLSSLYFRR